MNDFLKLVEMSGMVKEIRKLVPENDLEEFDEMVKNMIASGSQTYMSYVSKLTNYKEEFQGVKRVNNESSSEQGRDQNTDNE